MPRYQNPLNSLNVSFPGPAGDTDTLPDKKAVARRYGICVRTVDRWMADGMVPYLRLSPRVIRFRWGDVERALDRMTVKEVK